MRLHATLHSRCGGRILVVESYMFRHRNSSTFEVTRGVKTPVPLYDRPLCSGSSLVRESLASLRKWFYPRVHYGSLYKYNAATHNSSLDLGCFHCSAAKHAACRASVFNQKKDLIRFSIILDLFWFYLSRLFGILIPLRIFFMAFWYGHSKTHAISLYTTMPTLSVCMEYIVGILKPTHFICKEFGIPYY